MMSSAFRVIGDLRNPRLVGGIGGGRGPIGTGFFVDIRSSNQKWKHVYAVTAHHVLRGQHNIEIEASQPYGGALYSPLPTHGWVQPLEGVDLAIAPAPRREGEVYCSLGFERMLPDNSGLLWLGGKVHYIGLLAPLNRPMVRSGYLGAIDQYGVPHDLGYEYPCHLVDCRSYGGFSGSPCFVDLPFAGLAPEDLSRFDFVSKEEWEHLPPLGSLFHLAVFCGMFTQHQTDAPESGEPASKYGVGVMLRMDEIRQALMLPESQADREENEQMAAEEEASNEPKLRPASVQDANTEDEYERFETLTRHLANTPRPDEDKKPQ